MIKSPSAKQVYFGLLSSYQQVLHCHPDAFACPDRAVSARQWRILRSRSSRQCIAIGASRDAAWKNAANRVKEELRDGR